MWHRGIRSLQNRYWSTAPQHHSHCSLGAGVLLEGELPGKVFLLQSSCPKVGNDLKVCARASWANQHAVGCRLLRCHSGMCVSVWMWIYVCVSLWVIQVCAEEWSFACFQLISLYRGPSYFRKLRLLKMFLRFGKMTGLRHLLVRQETNVNLKSEGLHKTAFD